MRCLGFSLALSLLFIRPLAAGTVDADTVSIVPQPVEITRTQGMFVLTPSSRICYFTGNREMRATVEQLARRLRASTGYPLPIQDAAKLPAGGYIFFNYIREEELGAEGYRLEVVPGSVEINANGDAGFQFGMQTLLQLFPPEVYSPTPVQGLAWRIPCLSLMDKPRFAWRGMHLDVSRHFLPKEFIYTFLDMLALHKMNVFHWHLTDDQGWRLEIKKYPKLTSVGAWRADHESEPWSGRSPQAPGEKATYGGFYTQAEVKAIVRYAAERHITIVPEIEMPAHASAALAAYPEYSCTGEPITVVTGGIWPCSNVFCAGKDSTFTFIQNVLSEVIALFPSPYIHVGGDEADKTNWKKCPRCQARIKAEGLKNEEELQSYFMRRIGTFLASKKRKLIGWDEILEGGLAPGAAVMSWRGMDGGIAAVKAGHDVVMTPGSYCYFNDYQGDEDAEPLAGGGFLPLHRVYEFDPVPAGLSPAEAAHVLGGQGCLWGEFVISPERAQYMTLPRLAAMGERLWSAPGSVSWSGFVPRLERQMQRYDRLGYVCARSAYWVTINTVPDPSAKAELVALTNEMGRGELHYTLDGSKPGLSSPLYRSPFMVERTSDISAAAFLDGKQLGSPSIRRVFFHQAVFRPVKATPGPDARYPGKGEFCLTDGIRGGKSFGDGRWQGYLKNDLELVIDLGRSMPVNTITSSFLENTAAYIFYPKSVEYLLSENGSDFTPVARIDRPTAGSSTAPSIKEFTGEAKGAHGRYLKVRAASVGTVPAGFPGAAEPAWLFIDEVMVE